MLIISNLKFEFFFKVVKIIKIISVPSDTKCKNIDTIIHCEEKSTDPRKNILT